MKITKNYLPYFQSLKNAQRLLNKNESNGKTILNEIKKIIVSKSYLNQTKFNTLLFLKDLMRTTDEKFRKKAEKLIIPFLIQLAKSELKSDCLL